MRISIGLMAAIVIAGLLGSTESASAQNFGRGDRLFLLYNQINNRRTQQDLAQRQQRLSQQFQQFSGQGSLRGPVGPEFVDPVEEYLRQVEGGRASRRSLPPIYGGGRRQQTGSFQQHYRYFNPSRSPLY